MAVVIPGGIYSFTRGAPLPPEVAGGRQEGACDYFWAVIGYTSECPDVWAGELGILVDVIDESGFENCPATYPIEGSVDPGECPGNINDYDRASTTSFYCKDADGIFQYSGGSLCCEYFPCGTNPGVSGATLGCNCPEGVPCDACEGFPIPLNLTAEIIGGSCGGGTTELVWNGEAWTGLFNPVANAILVCNGSAWSLGIDEGVVCPGYLSTAECDGLELVFDFSGCSLCEGGAFQVRITPAE